MERGDRLAAWIDATFKSRAEGARALGMAPTQLGGYLADRQQPGADILARMAAAGLDVRWYLLGPPIEAEPPVVDRAAEPRPSYEVDPEIAAAMQRAPVLHAGDEVARLRTIANMLVDEVDRIERMVHGEA